MKKPLSVCSLQGLRMQKTLSCKGLESRGSWANFGTTRASYGCSKGPLGTWLAAFLYGVGTGLLIYGVYVRNRSVAHFVGSSGNSP